MTHYHKLCSLLIFTAVLSHNLIAQNPTTESFETNRSNIIVTNEKTINTGQLEFSPAFYEDGIVYITSQKPTAKEKIFDERIESSTMSIFLARRNEHGQLQKPAAFSNALVSSLHEGPLTFDKTGENIFFSRNNNEGNGKKATYTEGVSRLKIYTAQRKEAGNWSVPTELPFNENNSDACHPSISVDGDKLYFTSNRAGGYGGMDLYVSERINGIWGKPTNLGPKINTPKNEVFPYVHADGTLFYSSNGLPGSGGLDIYYLKNTQENGGLGVPVNLGAPFNTDKDDFGFIVDADIKNGYFTSSRSGGFGGDDIYAFNVPEGTLFDNLENEYAAEYDPATANRNANSPSPTGNGASANVNKNASMQTLNILVIDKQTGRVISDATASYLNLNDLSMSEIIADNNGKQAQIIKSDGTFALELVESKMRSKQTNTLGKAPILAAKTGTYLISASKKGYSTEQIVVKKGELKNDIIIQLGRPSDCMTLTGTVKNNVNGGPISYALVSMSDEKGDIKSIPTDQLGTFTICVPCGHNYRAYATKDGKMSTVERATTKNMDCTEGVERNLKPIELRIAAPVSKDFTINEGNLYQLRNIYYNFNDATIRPDARKDLEALFVVMTKFPDMEIELASHTDARGTDFYNKDLSQRRANSAVQYLVNRGIAARRILAKGYGESLLRNGCSDGVPCLENQHKLNRRTEVKITKSGSAEGQILTDFFTPQTGK